MTAGTPWYRKPLVGASGQRLLQLGVGTSLLIGFVFVPTAFNYCTDLIHEQRNVVPALESNLALQKIVHEKRQEFRRQVKDIDKKV